MGLSGSFWDALFKHFGLTGLVTGVALLVLFWSLRQFLRSIDRMSTMHTHALSQITVQLVRQEEGHKDMVVAQVQHTESLRSLAGEMRALVQGIHQSDLSRAKDLMEIISRITSSAARASRREEEACG